MNNTDIHIDTLFDDQECSMEGFRRQYIEDNKDTQMSNLDIWMDNLIMIWNTGYLKDRECTWNERVLLSIYILNYYMIKGKYKLDALYTDTEEKVIDRLLNLLDNVPDLDAIDDLFVEDLADKVTEFKQQVKKVVIGNDI